MMEDIFKHTDSRVIHNQDKLVRMYNYKAGEDMDPLENDDVKRLLDTDICYPLSY